ncbi:hypothetical protein Tco_1562286 [Tanacetum coccineum]
MEENQINDVMEVVKEIDLNKQVVGYNNELESDIEDILPEITDPDAVIEEVTDPEEIVCKNPSRARVKCGVKEI